MHLWLGIIGVVWIWSSDFWLDRLHPWESIGLGALTQSELFHWWYQNLVLLTVLIRIKVMWEWWESWSLWVCSSKVQLVHSPQLPICLASCIKSQASPCPSVMLLPLHRSLADRRNYSLKSESKFSVLWILSHR